MLAVETTADPLLTQIATGWDAEAHRYRLAGMMCCEGGDNTMALSVNQHGLGKPTLIERHLNFGDRAWWRIIGAPVYRKEFVTLCLTKDLSCLRSV